MYFLLNYGRGYTGEYVGSMTFEELNWHVRKVHHDLEERKRLQEDAARKLRGKLRSRRGR